MDRIKTDFSIETVSNKNLKYFSKREANQTIVLSCGDDRSLCEESIDDLNQLVPGGNKYFFRLYGGIFGLMHILTLYAEYNKGRLPEKFIDLAENPKQLIKTLTERLARQNVIATLHSDVGNEGSTHYEPYIEKNIGCAFAANMNAIISNSTNPVVLEYLNELHNYFGNKHSNESEILQYNNIVINKLLADKPGYNKNDFNQTGLPVCLLQGKHTTAEKTCLVLNYTNNISRLSDSGAGFYVQDIYLAVKSIIKSFSSIQFDIKTLFLISEIQAFSTSNVLAEHTHLKESTKMLPIQIYGDRDDAIKELELLSS